MQKLNVDKTNEMCVVVKVELDLSQKCMHGTGYESLSLSFCCNRNRTETERGTGTEKNRKLDIPAAQRIYISVPVSPV